MRQRKGFSEYTLFGGAPDRLVGQRKGFSSSENLAQAEDKEPTRARCRGMWSDETLGRSEQLPAAPPEPHPHL